MRRTATPQAAVCRIPQILSPRARPLRPTDATTSREPGPRPAGEMADAELWGEAIGAARRAAAAVAELRVALAAVRPVTRG